MNPTVSGSRRLGVACGVAAVASAVAGCAGPATPPTAADCADQVRLEGRVYTSHGYSEQGATRVGVADRAECRDTGTDPEGSVFPGDPVQVPVWSFTGYETEQVLGVRLDRDSFAVYVAESVSPAESERLFEELRRGRQH